MCRELVNARAPMENLSAINDRQSRSGIRLYILHATCRNGCWELVTNAAADLKSFVIDEIHHYSCWNNFGAGNACFRLYQPTENRRRWKRQLLNNIPSYLTLHSDTFCRFLIFWINVFSWFSLCQNPAARFLCWIRAPQFNSAAIHFFLLCTERMLFSSKVGLWRCS